MGRAIYNGDEKQWFLPLGCDLRQVVDTHPEWFDEPENASKTHFVAHDVCDGRGADPALNEEDVQEADKSGESSRVARQTN